jgi:hypothetical protein
MKTRDLRAHPGEGADYVDVLADRNREIAAARKKLEARR